MADAPITTTAPPAPAPVTVTATAPGAAGPPGSAAGPPDGGPPGATAFAAVLGEHEQAWTALAGGQGDTGSEGLPLHAATPVAAEAPAAPAAAPAPTTPPVDVAPVATSTDTPLPADAQAQSLAVLAVALPVVAPQPVVATDTATTTVTSTPEQAPPSSDGGATPTVVAPSVASVRPDRTQATLGDDDGLVPAPAPASATPLPVVAPAPAAGATDATPWSAITAAAPAAPDATPAPDAATSAASPAAPISTTDPTAATPTVPAPTAAATPTTPLAPSTPAAPATPAAALAQPAPVRLGEAVEALHDLIHVTRSRGGDHARLVLHPVELGGVEVRMRTTVHGLIAVVRADDPSALAVLQHAAGELRRGLEERGVTVASIDFDKATPPGADPDGRAAGGNAGTGTNPDGSRATRATTTRDGLATGADADDSDPTLDAAGAAATARPAGALVDVLA